MLTIAVVGGGPTGVELAPEILQFLRHRIRRLYPSLSGSTPRVILLQGGETLLPGALPCLQEGAARSLERKGVLVLTGARVERVTKHGLLYRRNGTLFSERASLIVWVTGVIPKTVEDGGRRRYDVYDVKPDLFLHDDPRILAVGDAAQFHDARRTPLPALAQAAVQEGKHAARNLVRRINGRATVPFVYRDKGFLFSLGQLDAMGEIRTPFGRLCIKGFFAWWLWRTVYLIKFLDARQRVTAAAAWTAKLVTRRSILREGERRTGRSVERERRRANEKKENG